MAKNSLGIRRTTPHTNGMGRGGWGRGRMAGKRGGVVKDKTADDAAVSQA